MIESDLADERKTPVKLLLSLAGEPDDEIGREGDIGNLLPQPIDDMKVKGAVIGSLHPCQHRVAARLNRQMQVIHHLGAFSHRLDQLWPQESWMRGDEMTPLDAIDLLDTT